MAELAPDLSEPGRTPSSASDVCPLLVQASGAERRLAAPDAANRCGAWTPPRAVGLLQQRLVCLDGAHADCPLFVRSGVVPRGSRARAGVRVGRAIPSGGLALGTVLAAEPAAEPSARPVAAGRRARSRYRRAAVTASLPSPTVIASILLVVALVVAFAFISIRGGLALPAGELAAESAVASAGGPVSSPPPSVSSSPSQSPSPSPAGTPSPSPAGAPSIAPVGTPAATAAALPTAYAGLDPCPDRPNCYLYRVRSGDTMTSIARHFGITPQALRAANPEISDPNLLHVGDILRVPLPPA